MRSKKEEIIIVAIASMLLIGVFGAIAVMDRSHGDVGAEYGIDQVNVSIESADGTIQVPDLPEDILIFGAGLQANMDFKVTNMDPDTDIDTIYVSIPDSIMTDSSYEWYVAGISHEWNMTNPQTGVVMYQAVDDYPGLNFGGSSQYDTAGNEDDALDYDATKDISESLTASIEFNAPTTTGFKVGTDAINVEIADLVTEGDNPRQSMSPFPYPYIVTRNGDTFVVMILETPSCDLEIVYDGQTYFGSSRASGFQTFESGIKYADGNGHTIVIVSHPGNGKIVKPIIRAKSAGLTGQFTLTVFNFTVSDITTGSSVKVPVAVNYKDNIPSDISTTVDNDIDGDGIYNKLDPDIDGDGQVNAEDRDPYDRNVMEQPPTGLQASVDKTLVKEGETFTLSAVATDANGDPVTFTWTVDKVSSWTKTGQNIVVTATGELKPGTYVFSVMATDGRSTVKPTDTVTVTIEEKSGSSNLMVIIPILALVIIILIVAAFFYFKKKEEPVLIEETIVPAKDEPTGQDVQIAEEESSLVMPPNASPKYQGESLVEIAEPVPDNINICPNCGTALGPDDTTCSSCGTEFEINLECPKCQSNLPQGSQTCPNCGMEFAS